MRWLLIPGTDRPAARRLVRRIDEILGFPREHAPAEYVVHGATGRALPPPRTETHMAILRHDATGDSRLHGAIAVGFTRAVLEVLADRVVDVGSARERLRDVIAARGWQVRDTLPDPGDETRQPWARRPPRDGEPGSATGRPIPEGEE